MKRSNSHGAPNAKRPSFSQYESDEEFDSTQNMIVNTQEENDTKPGKEQVGEASIGVLEKVELTDFMCHAKLVVDFCPNVNFILGRNGSGKSAIMTAIVVALGGNAKATERGQSLKQFIRTGCSRAVVQVQIRNRGSDGYQPEKYGSCIVIERTIKRDGTGSYKIKNKQRGTVVSTKKDELVRILDHMDIQINNPICMLNQDVSRNFLHSSNPKDKYKLFMRATLLEDIEKYYEQTKENLSAMTAGIKVQEQRLPVLESTAKELEEKVEMFDHIRKQGERVITLEKELQWAMIAEIEKNIPPIEAQIVKERRRIPKNQQKMDSAQANISEYEAELKGIDKELDGVMKRGSDIQKQRQQLETECRTKEKTVRTSQAQMKAICREMDDKKKEKNALEQKRGECVAMSQRDVAGEREGRLRELEQHQEKLRSLQGELDTVENDRRQFSHAAKTCKDQLHNLQGKISYTVGQVNDSEEKIERINSSTSDGLACFGNWTRPLVDAIQRNLQHFQRPPKGPIGSMIQLKDYKWDVAIEQVVKRSLLSAFVVDNQQDKATFKRIMGQTLRRNSFMPDIVVSPYSNSMYNTSRNKAQCNHPTVLDIVDVKDHDVLNVLIDQCKIESVLLIEHREAANRVIVHNKPRGAHRAFTVEGDEILPYAHYSNRSGRFGIIRGSNKDALREERAKLDNLNVQVGELQQRGAELQGELRANERYVREASVRIRNLTGEKGRLERVAMTLQDAEEEEDSQEDIATYDGEIAECEEKLGELSSHLSAQKEDFTQLKKELRESAARYQEVQNEVEEVAGNMEELRAHSDQALHHKREAENHMKFYQERVASIEKDIAELQAKADEHRKTAFESAENAVGERIETSRSSKSIESEINKLQRRIAEEEPNIGQQEEIDERYVAAMEDYERTQQRIDEQKHLREVLESGLRKRLRGFKTLRMRVTTMTCVFFTHFLRQRDYDGKLKFDEKKEKLEITVNVDQHTEQSQSTKNAKSLSGGERSFTTVCFILSLWYAMESPFQCLDEFDVFMDMMNRRICMRLMLDFSEQNSGRQFIFFTPQDMSSMGVEPSSRVKLFKLNPPERGQTTLD